MSIRELCGVACSTERKGRWRRHVIPSTSYYTGFDCIDFDNFALGSEDDFRSFHCNYSFDLSQQAVGAGGSIGLFSNPTFAPQPMQCWIPVAIPIFQPTSGGHSTQGNVADVSSLDMPHGPPRTISLITALDLQVHSPLAKTADASPIFATGVENSDDGVSHCRKVRPGCDEISECHEGMGFDSVGDDAICFAPENQPTVEENQWQRIGSAEQEALLEYKVLEAELAFATRSADEMSATEVGDVSRDLGGVSSDLSPTSCDENLVPSISAGVYIGSASDDSGFNINVVCPDSDAHVSSLPVVDQVQRRRKRRRRNRVDCSSKNLARQAASRLLSNLYTSCIAGVCVQRVASFCMEECKTQAQDVVKSQVETVNAHWESECRKLHDACMEGATLMNVKMTKVLDQRDDLLDQLKAKQRTIDDWQRKYADIKNKYSDLLNYFSNSQHNLQDCATLQNQLSSEQAELGQNVGLKPVLKISDRIILQDLIRSHMNGMKGMISAWDKSSQRFVVLLCDGTSRKFKPQNLHLEVGPCSGSSSSADSSTRVPTIKQTNQLTPPTLSARSHSSSCGVPCASFAGLSVETDGSDFQDSSLAESD